MSYKAQLLKRVGVEESFTPIIVDDFEHNAFSTYYGLRFAGSYTINSTTKYAGSYALKHDTTTTTGHYAFSYGTLARYPQAGDLLEFRLYIDSTMPTTGTTARIRVWGGLQSAAWDGAAFLLVVLNFEDNQIETENGTASVSSWPTNEWLRVEINWALNGDLTVRLYSASGTLLGSVTGWHTTYTSGGIRVGAFSNPSIRRHFYIDDIKVIGNAV